ncbi:MAG: hypothetical protein ABIG35_05345 [Pseudomonadota bacterium]
MSDDRKKSLSQLMTNSTKYMGIVIIGLCVSACSENWKEEVQLQDGRILVVERELISEGGGDEWASNRSGTKPKEYVIRFVNPDQSGKEIEWRSIKKSPETWPEIPLVLDMASGKPVILSIVAISPGCEVYSKYVHQDGRWIEEPLPEQFAQRTTNLLFGSHKEMPALVSLKDKRIRNNYVGVRNKHLQVGPNHKVCG